ncbi:MAG: translation initiation factor IF-2 [Syntrophorhabdaceae bacterium]|nr:translation initiation factor IF-2 [Syntrophorhabdaceae bacterium]
MDKVRIRDLAKDLGMETSKEIIAFLEKIGARGKSASSNLEGDLIERVKGHFKKPALPSPPPPTTVLTRSDGVIERRSQRVILRRGTPTPPPSAVFDKPEEASLEETAAVEMVSPEVVEEITPAETQVVEVAEAAEVVATPEQAPEAAEAVPQPTPQSEPQPEQQPEQQPAAEQTVRVVEKPVTAPKPEDARKEKEKKWKKNKPHEKKVQKGVLKQTIIKEVLGEPETEGKKQQEAVAPPVAVEPSNVRQFQPSRLAKRKGKQVKEKKAPSTLPPKASKRLLKIEEVVTVGDLAHRMGVKAAEVIKKLIEMGMPSTLNQLLDADTAGILAQEYGFEVENITPEMESLIDQEEDKEEDLHPRSPVITIMGHVDHGKTTLLDAIRESKVTETEAGGITQHIGAYEVEHGERRLVVLDTPGHEAFTAMRARGASVTDIVVLVVSADDGVMPQTVEAIDHAKAANVPIVVAVNKIDKPGAQPDRIRQQLSDHGLVPEEWGGTTLYANVSAKKRVGISELLELTLLQADVLELRSNPKKFARGTVIESRLEKGRGPVATVLVLGGTLRVGDAIVTGSHYGRVRALINCKGKRLDEAPPGTPVEIQGLVGLPEAGNKFAVLKDERTARQIALHRVEKERERIISRPRMSLEDLHRKIDAGEMKDLNIVIKSDVQGSMEALQFSLAKLGTDKVKVKVIHAGVGGISESDVMLASASSAVVIGFNVRPEAKGADLAEREGIDIRLYSIIYDVVDDIKKAMEGLLDPTLREVVQGRAEVRNTFHISKIGTIAGCGVINGKITRNSNVRLLRDNVVIYDGKLSSLKRFKDDVREVAEGYECGLGIENYNDIQVGDQIEAYIIEKIAGTLA